MEKVHSQDANFIVEVGHLGELFESKLIEVECNERGT